MTFIPREKPQGKTRWELTPEEWRLLTITFVGGLASIVLGAATVGAALAVARWVGPGSGWVSWTFSIATTLGMLWSLVYIVREGLQTGFTIGLRIVAGIGIMSGLVVMLAWVGLAAGVH